MSLKKKILFIIVPLVLLAVMGCLLGVIMLNNRNDNRQNVTLDGEGTMTDTLAVSLDGFYPTLAKTYTINLRSSERGNYKVKMQFEKVDDGTLGNYLDTKVVLNGEEIASGRLSEFLQGKEVDFESLLSRKAVIIEIFYTMPLEIGNEGQKATTNFNIKITASH